MQTKQKKIVIALAVVVILILIGLFIRQRQSAQNCFGGDCRPTPSQSSENNEDQLIPTVDKNVKINLTKATSGKDVILSIGEIPQGTETIDYELSYETVKQGLQGVIGTIKTEGKPSYEKQLTLGTCSSGTCVYHEVNGPIKLSLKFNGKYGGKIFEKDFSL